MPGRWPRGPPVGSRSRPGAWLTTVARRRAIDVAAPRFQHSSEPCPFSSKPVAAPGPGEVDAPEIIDDRLRLIFTCCHPAIATDAQVALTLRLVCGLTTAEVGRAFLVSEATMAARITRAKKKIAMARIPYRVPPVDELPSAHRRRAHRRPSALHDRAHCSRRCRPGPRATWWNGPSTWPEYYVLYCPRMLTSPACWP